MICKPRRTEPDFIAIGFEMATLGGDQGQHIDTSISLI